MLLFTRPSQRSRAWQIVVIYSAAIHQQQLIIATNMLALSISLLDTYFHYFTCMKYQMKNSKNTCLQCSAWTWYLGPTDWSSCLIDHISCRTINLLYIISTETFINSLAPGGTLQLVQHWLIYYVGLHLFNDETLPSEHISHPRLRYWLSTLQYQDNGGKLKAMWQEMATVIYD